MIGNSDHLPFQFIRISVLPTQNKRKTHTYAITSKGCGAIKTLGRIGWHSPWRRYVFYSFPDVVWDQKCLQMICSFLDCLMEDWKEEQKAKKIRKHRDRVPKTY